MWERETSYKFSWFFLGWIFMWSLLRLGEWKIAKMVAVHWPRRLPCPYMVKTFKKIFFSRTEDALGLNLWMFVALFIPEKIFVGLNFISFTKRKDQQLHYLRMLDTFSRKTTLSNLFCLPSEKENNCCHWEQILSFQTRLFRRGVAYSKANRKSKKTCLLCQKWQKI